MRRTTPLRIAGLLVGMSSPLLMGQVNTGYRMPSAALAALVDAPPTPAISLSPDRGKLLLLERASWPPVAELAGPEVRLAGLRIDPASNGPSRASHYTRLAIKSLADFTERQVGGFPVPARIRNPAWSPDGRHLLVTLTRKAAQELWVVDIAGASARRLTERPLNTVMIAPAWVDPMTIVAAFVPAGRGRVPRASAVPTGPVVQENINGRSVARTYPDLLTNAHDVAVFEHYAIAELAVVALDGRVEKLGVDGLLGRVVPSPDGRYLLVTTVTRPYSYFVPVDRFPQRITVRRRDGRLAHTVAELPLADNIPIPKGSVRTGPREVIWRADAPATLSWLEAVDDGDAGREAEWRDAWWTLAAPFAGAPVRQRRFGYRVAGIVWGDENNAIVTEFWWLTRRLRTWHVAPSRPGLDGALLFDRSSEDGYADPGSPVTRRNGFGRPVLVFNADHSRIYLEGLGASLEGDRPFLDEFDLRMGKARRIWRSQPPYYESFLSFLDDARTVVLTRRESASEPPNYFRRVVGERDEGGALAAVTDFPNPSPQFADVRKEIVSYQRSDGVGLSGTLYLPPGRGPLDGPLPTLLWAYPREYKDAAAAGQLRESPHRFVRVNVLGPLPFVLAGFAVFDDPTMPIIGEGEREPNDSYVEQLVASARAAVDELVRRGVTDPRRVAVGGHSYGAFMTANLLAHSDLFRAGIARSGAYNRTLTPFGFQAEQRTLWEAPEIYAAMSPFNHAIQVKNPLLLIHGTADNNTGTFPIQSERFYNALKAHGVNTRYVQLPHESHVYRGRENILHLLWESEHWLDTNLKPLPADR